jgi:hypothetical protein
VKSAVVAAAKAEGMTENDYLARMLESQLMDTPFYQQGETLRQSA